MINVRKSKVRATVTGFALIGCAVAGMTMVATRPAVAQAADANADKPISINMQNTPIQAVLKALFNSVGANYSIDADVAGSVNITMNNVGFLAALRSILHSTTPALTYDYTDGVYHIRVKKQDTSQPSNPIVVSNDPGNGGGTGSSTGTPSGSAARFYKMPVDHYDVVEMARLIATSSVKGGFDIVPAGIGASGQGGASGNGSGGGSPSMSGGIGGSMGGGGMSMGGGMGMGGGGGMGRGF